MSDITDEQIDRVLFQVFNVIDRSEVWGLARQEAATFRQAVRMALADPFVFVPKAPTRDAPAIPGIVGKWVKSGNLGPGLVLDCAYQQPGGYEYTRSSDGEQYKDTHGWPSGFVLLVQVDDHVVEWIVGGDSDIHVVDAPGTNKP